jgi:hypothetical protein
MSETARDAAAVEDLAQLIVELVDASKSSDDMLDRVRRALAAAYERGITAGRSDHERTLARADRYEAEFSACKALLIAAQQRAERAEAERAEARAALETYGLAAIVRLRGSGYEPWPEAAQAEVLRVLGRPPPVSFPPLTMPLSAARAALPVEPARLQVTEITQEAGTPRTPNAAAIALHRITNADGIADAVHIARCALAELARSNSEPAPQNPPPSPTGDAE